MFTTQGLPRFDPPALLLRLWLSLCLVAGFYLQLPQWLLLGCFPVFLPAWRLIFSLQTTHRNMSLREWASQKLLQRPGLLLQSLLLLDGALVLGTTTASGRRPTR